MPVPAVASRAASNRRVVRPAGNDDGCESDGVPELCDHQVCLVSQQLYQTLAGELLRIMRMYKSGAAHLKEALDDAVTRFLEAFEKICKIVGKAPLFAKSHELLHLAEDLVQFGSSIWTSAGVCACRKLV